MGKDAGGMKPGGMILQTKDNFVKVRVTPLICVTNTSRLTFIYLN